MKIHNPPDTTDNSAALDSIAVWKDWRFRASLIGAMLSSLPARRDFPVGPRGDWEVALIGSELRSVAERKETGWWVQVQISADRQGS